MQKKKKLGLQSNLVKNKWNIYIAFSINPHPPHLYSQAGSNLGSCSVAQSDNHHLALKSSIYSEEPWIIDSSTSNHMTGGYDLFHSYVPCSSNTTVKIADGSSSSVARVGTIKISKDLNLKIVLHVPS